MTDARLVGTSRPPYIRIVQIKYCRKVRRLRTPAFRAVYRLCSIMCPTFALLPKLLCILRTPTGRRVCVCSLAKLPPPSRLRRASTEIDGFPFARLETRLDARLLYCRVTVIDR